ncbi:MAG: Hpt domain-containing protein [Pseudomonadota bacterium]|nr:Hpt domain-containing protein [Pseudomonadota bacterium]
MTTVDRDIDPGAWDELLQLFGRDGVAEMLDALQRDLPVQQERLADALAADNRSALKSIAHSLRGVALQFGAAALAQSCGDVEQSAAGQMPTAQLGTDTVHLLDGYVALLRSLQDVLHDA